MEADDEGRRLDVFLAESDEPPMSRSQVKRRVEAGEVLVNGALAKKSGHALKSGDHILWNYIVPQKIDLIAEDIALDFLYEDSNLAIVNKPAGMVVHPAPGHPSGTLVNALLHHFDDLDVVGDAIRPGIVHRIDKDTSGALVVTKNNATHQHLSELFRAHTIERTYHAVVFGPGLKDEDVFDTLHGRSPRDRKRYTINVRKGRRAVTHYKVLERFEQGAALVECKLETGRTHQIRMHFFEANAPLIADPMYAGRSASKSRLIKRQALHARTLGFPLLDGTALHCVAPYPDDFASMLEALRARKDWRK